MHIPPYDNDNCAIIAPDDPDVPLCYFNIVKLKRGETFKSFVPGYETCLVPAHGTIDVQVCDGYRENAQKFEGVGQRSSVFEGEPSAVYVPLDHRAHIACISDTAEVFVAGAKAENVYRPFVVRPGDVDPVQYGSDDTKTHRKIKHILGKNQAGQVDRLLVSELFTVGAGGWSGFPPHKHEVDRLPGESRHDEVYNYRFRPENGFGLQLEQHDGDAIGAAHHVVNGSTFKVAGYHPVVAAPGYEMYYFTILAGQSQRPLVQNFQPEHAYQLETIPGIKDMIAKFK